MTDDVIIRLDARRLLAEAIEKLYTASTRLPASPRHAILTRLNKALKMLDQNIEVLQLPPTTHGEGLAAEPEHG